MPLLSGWPTDGGDGSVSTEARWRKMARTWAPSGVVYPYLGHMVPSYSLGNVTVQEGAAWVDGHYCEQLTSSSVAVTSNGLVVIRFVPLDNTFELLYRDGATTPTQTTATWELPLARMSGGAMTDLRVFVNHEYIHTSMIADEAVDTGKIADQAVTTIKLDDLAVTTGKIDNEAVTAAKLAGGAVTNFIQLGGSQTETNTTLTTSFQSVVTHTFTKPTEWVTYEMSIWGGAAIEALTAETCEIRVSAGGNNGDVRTIEVGGGLHMEVGSRARFAGATVPSLAVTVDVRRATSGAATVESAWIQYLALRST